jgi:tRNA(adenine34) deaminase
VAARQRSVVDREQDEKFMRMALEEAQRAGQKGEIPVGALLVKKDQVLARAHNRCIELSDPTAHAEILALRRAGERLGNYRLNDTVMYVTIEPCPMCVAAMIHGRISRLIFGASEPKFGAIESKFKLLRGNAFYHHFAVTRGVLETECGEVLKSFFRKKREAKKQFGVGSSEFGVKNKKSPGSRLKAHRYKVTPV